MFDTAGLHAAMPLCAALGVRVAAAGPDGVRLELDWQERLCTTGGILHGGALMALADSAGALCAHLNLPDGATGTTTLESSSRFLAAARGGTVTAVAVPLHAGRTTAVVETEVRDADGRLLAKTTQSQAVLRARSG